MTTNLQLAKLSNLVYEADGGASKISQMMGADWQWYADPGSLGISFTNGYYAAAYRNTATGEIVIAHRGTEPTDGGDIVADLNVKVKGVSFTFNFQQPCHAAHASS